jgi:hypothetical protein
MLVTEWATSRPPNPIFAVSGCRVPSTGQFWSIGFVNSGVVILEEIELFYE